MPRKKDEILHARRQKEILEAAKKCFVKHGFHQTSMRQILDEAGISAGGAYNYFAGKDDIIKAFVNEERSDIDLLITRAKACKEPLQGIAQLVFESIKYTDHDGAILAAEVYAEACRNPEIKALEQSNLQLLELAFSDFLTKGMKTGEINRSHSFEESVEFLLALIEGYISRLATNSKLSPTKAAAMAKATVIQLLSNDK